MPEFHQNSRMPSDEQLAEFQAAVLISSHAPLHQDSIDFIKNIESDRLLQLFGEQKYAAIQFFEAVSQIPIIHVPWFEKLLHGAGEGPLKAPEKDKNKPVEKVKREIDEFGFFSLPFRNVYGPSENNRVSNHSVMIDDIAGKRNFRNALAAICKVWPSIEPTLRPELVADWIKTIPWRGRVVYKLPDLDSIE